MKFVKFEIKNFKGINELTLDLNKLPHGKIFPLVGLNESGKTTILEAIDLFQNRFPDEEEYRMIHKTKQGNFNDNVEVKATLQLEKEDLEFFKEFLKSKKLEQKEEISEITITKRYKFKNSKFEENGFVELWSIPLVVKTKARKDFVGISEGYKEHRAELVKEIRTKLLPRILYFENFIFDFPSKIYLEPTSNAITETDSEIQKEYREILKDILNSIDSSYSLDKHILSRFKSQNDDEVEAGKKILNEMSQKLNKIIVNSWKETFKNSSEKSIEIEPDKDIKGHFLKFKIKEGSGGFSIGERSLGFRWFFGFLLFTEFRKARKGENGEYLFLFDEPANNLHQRSQQKLLELFEKLTDKSKIIYSTHSHYLLTPKFLLTSFVVKDDGKKENEDGEIEWDNYSQDINANPYRSFVADSTNEETHFQPLLDCLEYVESPFEKTNNIVFFEGKSDYYTFKWIKEQYFSDKDYNFNLYAGASVDKYENIFREYLANNKKFIAVFDDDGKNGNGGIGAKERYIEEISEELKNNIFTLKDVNENFAGFRTEGLFFVKKNDDKIKIQKLVEENDDVYDKKRFNKAVQICFIKGEKPTLMKNTLKNFQEVFDFIQKKFEDLEK